VANTAQIEHALLECTIDLALVEGTPTEPHIISKHWQNDLMSIVIPSNFKPTKNLKAWLNKQFWLLREPGSGTLEMSVKLLAQHGVQAEQSMQLGSNEAIARSVAQGMGVALLPNVVTEDLVQLGKLTRLSQKKITSNSLGHCINCIIKTDRLHMLRKHSKKVYLVNRGYACKLWLDCKTPISKKTLATYNLLTFIINHN